jgi:hypothetical protein
MTRSPVNRRGAQTPDPNPEREQEKERDERLTLPGTQNYERQLDAELDACERYWRGGS